MILPMVLHITVAFSNFLRDDPWLSLAVYILKETSLACLPACTNADSLVGNAVHVLIINNLSFISTTC